MRCKDAVIGRTGFKRYTPSVPLGRSRSHQEQEEVGKPQVSGVETRQPTGGSMERNRGHRKVHEEYKRPKTVWNRDMADEEVGRPMEKGRNKQVDEEKDRCDPSRKETHRARHSARSPSSFLSILFIPLSVPTLSSPYLNSSFLFSSGAFSGIVDR